MGTSCPGTLQTLLLGLGPCVCSPQGSGRCGKPEAKCSSDWLPSQFPPECRLLCKVGKCAEALSDCQLPPLWALPPLRQLVHISPTPWRLGVAASGTAGLRSPQGMACCPGADSCRLSAASRVASAAESCLPAVTPFPGPPDCPTPDRRPFWPTEDNSEWQHWLHDSARTGFYLIGPLSLPDEASSSFPFTGIDSQ